MGLTRNNKPGGRVPNTELEFKDLKFATMPSKRRILRKLTEAGLFGKSPLPDVFYTEFAREIAGTTATGFGLMAGWNKVSLLLREQKPKSADEILDTFNATMDAIAPKDVAEQAKAMWGENESLLHILRRLEKYR